MSLKFVLGPSGYGKSTYVEDYIISESMANENRNYLLIVPDQFTMETQLEMVKKHPNGGILNIDVLSFGRLSYRIFSEIGESPKTLIDDTGKCLLLRRAASKHKDELSVLKGLIDRQGYIETVKASISELMQYSITAENVDEMAEFAKDAPHLQKKLQDISILYKGFNEELADSYITREERLSYLARNLYKSELIKNSVVVFDGFTGFTPIQIDVIKELVRNSIEVIITLTLRDTDDIKSEDNKELCSLSVETYEKLIKVLDEEKLPVEDSVILDRKHENRFEKSENLAFLEKNIFSLKEVKARENKEEAIKDITVCKILNADIECRKAAERIMNLTKDGMRYRDISIVTGDMDTYGEKLAAVFDRYDIPYYIDRNKDVLLNPLITYIRSTLLLIINNYHYNDVINMIRTGLSSLSIDEADRLDNYLYAKGIIGKNEYVTDFVYKSFEEPDDYHLKAVNWIREKLMKDLQPWLDYTSSSKLTSAEWTELLYDYLVKMHVDAKLKERAEALAEKGEKIKAREYESLFSYVCELLERVHDMFNEPITAQEFLDIINAGFGEIHIGMLPQSVDVVIVGDLVRSRLSSVKALLLLGADDGNIPGPSGHMSIFNDTERNKLKGCDFTLAPTKAEEIKAQKMYLYMTVTKPTEKLFISYPGISTDGKQLNPSYLINNIEAVMPEVIENNQINFVDNLSVEDEIERMCKLLSDFNMGILRKDDEEELIQIIEDLYFRNMIEEVESYKMRALNKNYDLKLSKEVLNLLYEHSLSMSATSLKEYAKCPYLYFAEKVLYLHDRENSLYDAMSTGIVIHDVLKNVLGYIQETGADKAEMSEIERRVDESIDATSASIGKALLSKGRVGEFYRNNYRKILKRNMEVYLNQLKKGKFDIKYLEEHYKTTIPFEADKQKKNITLTGQLDRLDIMEDDKNVYLKVVDYKTGSEEYNYNKFLAGEQMQLPIYLMAAADMLNDEVAKGEREKKNIVNAAILYQKAQNVTFESTDITPEVDKKTARMNAMAPNGRIRNEANIVSALNDESFLPKGMIVDKPKVSYISGEEMDALVKSAKETIGKFASEIASGEINKHPLYYSNDDKACDYCGLKGMCNFKDTDKLEYRIPGKEAEDNE